MNTFRWRMDEKCADCPFATDGKGAFLASTLKPGRMASIKRELRGSRTTPPTYFVCHKTTGETGNGTNLVCAGALEYQEARAVYSNYQRVCERLAWLAEQRKANASPDR